MAAALFMTCLETQTLEGSGSQLVTAATVTSSDEPCLTPDEDGRWSSLVLVTKQPHAPSLKNMKEIVVVES